MASFIVVAACFLEISLFFFLAASAAFLVEVALLLPRDDVAGDPELFRLEDARLRGGDGLDLLSCSA